MRSYLCLLNFRAGVGFRNTLFHYFVDLNKLKEVRVATKPFGLYELP